MTFDAIMSANTKFGFRLFGELAKDSAGENLFISPASISIALAMLYNGAAGGTQEALAQTLFVEGVELEKVNQANAALLEGLRSAASHLRLAIANALWAAQGVPLNPAFIQRLKDVYDARAAEVDFSDPMTLRIINDWVKQRTEGKIEAILDRLDPSTLLMLINAVTFKGRWTRPFDEENTREGLFTLLDGSRKTVPMMYQSGSYRVYRGKSFQAVRLPYGEGRAAMYVFLPHRRASLELFQKHLTAENWDFWMSSFRPMEGSIVLPRFKLKAEKRLDDTLKAIGMGVAFGPEADFSAMSDTPASVSQVIHKTFVEVNEEGTEAAATTAVTVLRTAMVPHDTFRMVVDRPFFCAIRDDRTGALLFMGSIVDPH